MRVAAWGSSRALRRATAALIALTLMASFAALASGRVDRESIAAAEAPVPSTTSTVVTTTTLPPTTTVPPTTEPPTTVPPTTAPPPPPPEPPPLNLSYSAAPLPAPGAYTFDPYTGLGTWIDVYDWSITYGGGAVDIPDIDRMASLGVQTLYVQATRWDAETLVLEADRLVTLIRRARADGMRVVAWYLPDLGDPQNDLDRLMAIAQLPIDGIGVDIESRKVADVNDRNQRVLALSAALRQNLPGQVLSAIVLPPVVMEDVNPNYWPDYPWAGLAQYYDVWQPMGYWTNRIGGWRDAYTYTAVNIDRVRAHIGQPDAPVHPIGGIGDETTPEDITGFQQAVAERGAIGASLYDYRTTGDALWGGMQAFRTA